MLRCAEILALAYLFFWLLLDCVRGSHKWCWNLQRTSPPLPEWRTHGAWHACASLMTASKAPVHSPMPAPASGSILKLAGRAASREKVGRVWLGAPCAHLLAKDGVVAVGVLPQRAARRVHKLQALRVLRTPSGAFKALASRNASVRLVRKIQALRDPCKQP